MKKQIYIFFIILALCLIPFLRIVSESSNGDSISSEPTNSENTKEAIDFTTLSMVCLGDSLTMSREDGTSYPDSLKEELGLVRVTNYGVGWSTLGYMPNCSCHPTNDWNHSPMVYRYSAMEKADIIGVMGGTNDYGVGLPIGTINDYSSTTFYGALNILVDGLQNLYPDSYIFFMTQFAYDNGDDCNGAGIYRTEYNEAIKAVCLQKGIDCFDVANELEFSCKEDTIDEVHPTKEFVDTIWVPKLAEFIKDNYR